MAYQLVTGSVDLTTKGRRVAAYAFANTGTAATINLRDGGVGGDLVWPILVPATTGNVALTFPRGLLFPHGVYVQVTGGTITGSIDIEG